MFLIAGILGFIFLLLYFWNAVRAAELHSKAAVVRENPIQKLLWKILGKWTGYLFAVFIFECVCLGIGGFLTDKVGPAAGAVWFGLGIAFVAAYWPEEK